MISRPPGVRALVLGSLLGLSLLLAALPPAGATDEPSRIPAAGTAAPDFTLQSQEGMPVSLHQFRGRWVVLYFYPKDMTTGCTIEAHGFQRDLAKYEQRKVQVLGVSVDSVDSHKEFCAKDALHFTLLSDTTHEVASRYGSLAHYGPMTLAARNTFLIDPKGIIRRVFVKVNPTPHSEEVLAALAELQKGEGN
ncbi:MAG TPA: peroxiredoxin [Candidatus Acidoferrales bacterium]|nr:peroxiredoxin [Candidatus Acidoferrales bacterium]